VKIECTSRRVILEDTRISYQKKWINAVILPSNEEDMSNIKLIKEKSGHYYWASMYISNQKLTQSLTVNLEEKPNAVCKHLLAELPLGMDYQISFDSTPYLQYEIVNRGGNFLEFGFSPQKEMEVNHNLFLMINNNEYAVNVVCKSPAIPIVAFPEIFSFNLAEKCSSLILLNPCDSKGVYRAKIEPAEVFSLDSW
jgi:hypothetical protein